MAKFFILLLLILAIPAVVLGVLSSHSTLAFDPVPKAIGKSTPVSVHITDPHGVRRITAAIEQNGTRTPLAKSDKPATRLTFWRSHVAPSTFEFKAGSAQAPNLKPGKARLIVEAQSNDLLAATDTIATEVEVIFRPPSISADGFQHYINQGGSGMAVFTVTGSSTESGVRVGDRTFRSFPLPGSPNQRVALFAFSWNTPPSTEPVIYAKNAAGDQSVAHISFKLFPKKFRARDLGIDDRFLDKVVNQIEPNGSGDLLPRFLKINSEMRRENNKTIADLRFKTAPQFLWTEPFLQLANSKVESEFADVRSYIYKGKKVDQQTHLGFDLAVSAHTPVVAANAGKVVWAGPLGIYGNCIVLDHGLSLQSIYGHLSEIAVKDGDMVKRGQVMGKSGSTGLAGGDHLHFSMQIEGVQVNPIEWWDAHWIKDHITDKMRLQ